MTMLVNIVSIYKKTMHSSKDVFVFPTAKQITEAPYMQI